MRTLVEQLEIHAQDKPNTAVLFDEQIPKGLTFLELSLLS